MKISSPVRFRDDARIHSGKNVEFPVSKETIEAIKNGLGEYFDEDDRVVLEVFPFGKWEKLESFIGNRTEDWNAFARDFDSLEFDDKLRIVDALNNVDFLWSEKSTGVLKGVVVDNPSRVKGLGMLLEIVDRVKERRKNDVLTLEKKNRKSRTVVFFNQNK